MQPCRPVQRGARACSRCKRWEARDSTNADTQARKKGALFLQMTGHWVWSLANIFVALMQAKQRCSKAVAPALLSLALLSPEGAGPLPAAVPACMNG